MFIIRIMKKLFLSAVLCFGVVQAANPAPAVDSSASIIGALEALPTYSSSFVSNYVPDYGVVIVGFFSPFEPAPGREAVKEATQTIAGVLTGLAPTVQGVQEGDWLSVSASVTSENLNYVTVRLKPGQPETLETWIDGELVAD